MLNITKWLERTFLLIVWGIVPAIPIFIILIAAVYLKVLKKDKVTGEEEIKNKRKSYKTEKIYRKNDYVGEGVLLIWITIWLIPLILLGNAEIVSYIEKMFDKIDVVGNVVIGVTSLVITMATVIVVFDKRYYLVFSIKEVLQQYKVAELLIVILISCILVVCAGICLLDGQFVSWGDYIIFIILEIATVYNLLGSTVALFIMIKVMFIEQKNELKLLDKLYRFFWTHRIDTLSFKKERWTQAAILTNLEYLIERYMDICNKINTTEIEEMEFVTTIGCHREKWCKHAGKRMLKKVGIIIIICSFFDICFVSKDNMILILINVLVFFITMFIAFSKTTTIQIVIMRLFSDTLGYYIRKKNNREYFVPNVAIGLTNKYGKYVMRMNSLDAFFCILLEYVSKKQVKVVYKDLLKRFEGIDERNMVTLCPIFTIGYFLYEKGIKIKKIRVIYNSLELITNEKITFSQMISSQIISLKMYNSEDIFQLRGKIYEYINWIKGNADMCI